jgi:hypothetical protein
MVQIFDKYGNLKTDASITGPIVVTGPLTDAELRASPVPVTMTGGGDATAANQTIEIARLTSILAQLDVALSTRASEATISSILAKIIVAPATEAKQDSEIALIATLNSLIETNSILVQRLEQIASAMNSGQPALRTIPIASVSTPVTGSVTVSGAVTVASTSITNFGTNIPASEMSNDMNNLLVTMANINNVTV